MMISLAMNGFISRSVLFSIVSSLALTLAPRAGAQDAGVASASAAEAARRKMAVRDAVQQIQEAREAYTAGRYGVAVDKYKAALEAMPVVPATEKQVKFIKDSLADALVAMAMDYRKVGRTDEAVEFLQEAQEVSPGHKFAAAEMKKTLDPVRNNPALTPQHIGNVAEVKRLLTLAFGYYDLGRFDKADETFDAVLRIDAYNTAARRGKEMVTNRKMAYLGTAHDSYRAKMLSDVAKAWEERVPDEHTATDIPVAGEGEVVAQTQSVEASVAAALKEMIIPEVSFEGDSVMDVQEKLAALICRFEASGIRASRPINVLTDFGSTEDESYKRLMSAQVNLRMSNISVLDLLNYIDSQLGITHYISDMGIQFMLSGRDYGPIVERTYTVPPHFFDTKSSSEDDEEEGDFSSYRSTSVKRVNPMVALKEMGITFPKGAHARYIAKDRALVVRNTLFNHKEIEELVTVPLSTQRAVSLNVIAMEVSEDDLKELGFEWLFNAALHPEHMFLSGAEALTGGMPAIETKINAQTGLASTDGLRSGKLVLSADNIDNLISAGTAAGFHESGFRTRKAPGIFAVRGVWSFADVTMVMRGADQKKGVDIINNPSILFTPGRDEQVVYANVREMFYPESYSAPQTSGANVGSPIATPSHPESFVRFGMVDDTVGGVGTVLQIHEASVDDDGENVTLALTLTTNEFEGFVNWGNKITSAVVHKEDGKVVAAEQVVLTENNILMPIFKRYLENTKLTVANGAVVVLGGLKESRTVKYEDKLPVMGDLPIVGRLFRSEGSEVKRTAYMVFVKVDIVDPTGKVIGTGADIQNVTDL